MAENSYYLLDECFPEVLMEHHLHAKDSSLVNTLVKFLFKWLISSSAIFKLNNNCDCGYQICMIWLQLPREIHIMLSIYHADFIKNRMPYFRVLIIMKPFWYLLWWNWCWLDSRVVLTVKSSIFRCKLLRQLTIVRFLLWLFDCVLLIVFEDFPWIRRMRHR